MTSALDLVVFTEFPVSFGPFGLSSLGLSVSRGPRSEVLLGALYDVGAFRLSPTSALWSFGPFVVGLSDCTYLTEVRGPSGLLLSFYRLSVSSRSEVRGL